MKLTMKQAATLRGLSRKEVGKVLGVSEATISKYYQMEAIPRADKAVKFSDLVKIPFNDIIFFNQEVDAKETSKES